MAGYALKLGGDHSQPYAPGCRLDTRQLLDGQNIAEVVERRGDVIGPVSPGREL
jgi:hypothetical protein